MYIIAYLKQNVNTKIIKYARNLAKVYNSEYNIAQEVITMTDFSTRLRDIVDSRGVTQTWLAEQTGTTEATISRYMQGVHKPSLDIVSRIAQALNVSIDYIMDLNLSQQPYREPEKDIVVLANAYRRADDDHKNIIWSVLDSYLSPEEKTFVSQMMQGGVSSQVG